MLELIPCTMGLPALDESLTNLMKAMATMPQGSFLGDTELLAKSIAMVIAIGIGSYEAWMMMLGRRGMDVMKILRIAIISVCISQSGLICSTFSSIGMALEEGAREDVLAKNQEVAAFELKVAERQADYLNKLRAVQDSIAEAKKIEELGEDAEWWEELMYSVTSLGSELNNLAQRAAVAAETKISEIINEVLRFIGELVFQMSIYGMLVASRIFMALMETFAPIMFAISLAPPWKSAWSQWLSKYISLSLWGYVAYCCIYYVDFILLYNLEMDLTAYDTLLNGAVDSWSQIGALGMQGIGSNCMYVMGLLVGAYVLRFVPEVASWLIPGGVSSGMGGSAGAVQSGAMSVNSHAQNSVANMGAVGSVVAHPGTAFGKAVGKIGSKAVKK